MAKPLSTGSENTSAQSEKLSPGEFNRRASDRAKSADDAPTIGRRASDRDAEQGSRNYGRRSSDGVYVAPKSRKANLAIWSSFIFSSALILWAFSRPFLGQGAATGSSAVPEAELAKMEVEARMSAEDYVSYTQRMERDLLDEYQSIQSRPKPVAKSKVEIHQDWEERIEKRKSTLKKMKKENKGEPFLKGTVQWEHEKHLEKMLEDTPPEAK